MRVWLLGFIVFSFSLLSSPAVFSKAGDELTAKLYDETIFVISNFSGVDANLSEPKTIQELLNQNIGGFRFYLEWEKQQNQLMIKKADGSSIPFSQTMHEIKNFLDNKPDKILQDIFLPLPHSSPDERADG